MGGLGKRCEYRNARFNMLGQFSVTGVVVFSPRSSVLQKLMNGSMYHPCPYDECYSEKKKLYKSSEIKSAKDIWQVKKKYGEIEQYQEQNLNMLKETMSTGGNFP